MKAVVLAAGEGVRMRPLTFTKSKHMLPIGRDPIIAHVLNSLRECGIRDTLLVVGYKQELIRNYLGDGTKFGIDLNYVVQEKALGTAHAIGLAKEYVGKEDFLVIYGDLLVGPEAVKAILQAHGSGGIATMAVVPVAQPEQYGIVKLDGNRVIDILEKPGRDEASGNLANAGIYIFSKEIFNAIERTHVSFRNELEVTDSLRLLIEAGDSILAVQIDPEVWMDIGRPWDLLEANKRVLQRMELPILGEVERGACIMGPVGLGEGGRVRSGAYVEGPTWIGEESDVGPNCYIRPYTSIGRKVRVGNACEIKNSIISSETRIGHLSYVGDSVIGERCNLGAGTITANLRLNGETIRINVGDKVVDSGRRKLGAFLGDEVKTAIHVSLMPGVKIGPRTWIGPNVTIYHDLPPNVLVLQRQELNYRKPE
ncbi:NTP transferase domain-containing protein [Candidatus Bathyarchaeota archaeon]|nr:NTP transferase domain-containing protein [Candidatus Bathyarchaeota archaeon]